MLKNVFRAIGWVEWRRGREYAISDKGGHPLDRTRTSYCQRMWGRMTVPRSGRPIKLSIQTEWWNDSNPGERLGLVIHEATHLKHHHHKPEFWEICIQNYRKVAESPYFQNVDWDEAADFAEDDPNTACVDRRCESVSERKERMRVVRNFR